MPWLGLAFSIPVKRYKKRGLAKELRAGNKRVAAFNQWEEME
jgi:hypothetical protein